MSNIERIRQKLDQLYDGEVPKHDQQCNFDDGYFHGLATIENFIDSLPEEKPSDELEEAAEISFDEARALTEDYRDFLAKGLTENRPRPIGPHWFCEYAKNRFIAGAEWQEKQDLRWAGEIHKNGYDLCKEQILKDAVEGEVEELYNDGESQCTVGVGTYFKPGDEVYVIKKED